MRNFQTSNEPIHLPSTREFKNASSTFARNMDVVDFARVGLPAMYSLRVLESSRILQSAQLVAVVTACTFLLAFTSSLVLRKASRIKYPIISGTAYVLLSCQTLLCSFTIFRTFLAPAAPADASVSWATSSSMMLFSEITGSLICLAHFLTGQPQTPRILYASAMLGCETVAAFTAQDFWSNALAAALYFSICAAELSIPISIRLRERSSIEEAPFFARVNFSWLASLFEQRGNVSLDLDMLSIPGEMLPRSVYGKFPDNYDEKTIELPGFWVLLWKVCKKEVLLSFCFELADITFKFVQPWIFRAFLLYQQPFLVAVIFFINVANSVVKTQASYEVKKAGLKLRSGIANAIFEKTVLLPPTRSEKVSVANLTEVDTQRLQDFIVYVHAVWSAPLQTTICLVSIALVLGGPSALAAFMTLLISMPLFSQLSSKMGYWQGRTMIAKDARISLTSEILHRIKTVKLYGQQFIWAGKLDALRVEELRAMGPMAWLIAAMNVLMRSVPMMISIAAFGTVLAMSRSLSSEKSFPALLMFGLLVQPLALIPMVASTWSNCRVSYKRLQDFFSLDDLPSQDPPDLRLCRWDLAGVMLENVTFGWPGAASEVISNMSLSLTHGKLVTITGPTGSGKSTILHVMMGIVQPQQGDVNVRGTIAYVPQNAWLLSGTIRDNIILHHGFDFHWYIKVIEACALDVDFKLLPNGDSTFIGNIGASLSGGQKARITLARAAYSKAQIIFFDDPLVAVDNKVRAHLTERVLGPHGILNDRLRIVASNSSQLIEISDQNFALREGKLVINKSARLEVLATQGISDDVSEPDLLYIEDLATPAARRISTEEGSSAQEPDKTAVTTSTEIFEHDPEATEHKKTTHTTEEDVSQLRVPDTVYWRWLHAAGVWRWCLVLLGVALAHGANVASVYVLRLMADYESGGALFYMGLYSLCGALQAILIGVWLMVAWYFCELPTSHNLHSHLVKGTLGSPMFYFDNTPIGQIINRFTNDLLRMDTALYGAWLGILNSAVRIVTAIAVLVVTSPFSLLYMVPLLLICWHVQRRYISICLQLKRLETSSRSPLLNNLQEIQNGAATIRAFSCADPFRTKQILAIQRNIEASFSLFCLELWLTMRLEFYSTIIQTLSAAVLLYQDVGVGSLGLVMSYLLQVSAYLTSTVLLQTQVESEMVSVQRVLTLGDNTPEGINSNSSNGSETINPAAAWPVNGAISFINYSASYQPGAALSLRDITLDIKANEKIAVVGRTGAGKSSFALALLRILEAASGSIVIDGIDISQIKLEVLRSRVTIIPQECQAFTGSVRENLDPDNVYDEAQLLSVIRDSCFDTGLATPQDALDLMLVDGGSNLSSGQRQLLALARAMLVNSKILILDEATATIDTATELLVQKTLHEYFSDKTTITIAHRLQTIMGSDRVVVLDQGRVAEVGSPKELIGAGGIFAGLLRHDIKST
ncbi:P-loop containing nucleoside triphosphate hydrolase protein [Cadophora sp. DSE1049]|nr:P-loop containing nucleoside triphosphate hydrolase protein [Cadophora sp. DSE1049]